MNIIKAAACSLAGIGLLLANCPSSAQGLNSAGSEKFQSIALAPGAAKSQQKILVRDGVPFIGGSLRFSNGPAEVTVGGAAKRIYLLGMAEDARIRCWADPTNHSVRFFVGDHLGQI
ncbi:MAG: hypothetical protein ACREFR_14495, partial [Limisphaerales bacterium]